MNNFISKIRNEWEASNKVAKYGNFVANNFIYKSIIFIIAKRKINNIRESRRYNIALELSSFCNGKCFFCPNSKMKRNKSNMSMEIFDKVVERMKIEKILPMHINLTGTGEPLMDKTIFQKIEILKNNFPDANVYLPTNFALADDEIIDKLVNSKLNSVAVSLNANNARDYKNIMKLDFDKTIKNLENLIKKRNYKKSLLKIYITLAANPINKKSVNEFIKFWEGKVDGVGINWIHSWAGAVNNGKIYKKNQIRYPCRPLFEQIIVHSNGNIPLCLVDYEGKFVGGNVMKNGILDSFYGESINKIREKHLSGKIGGIEMCSQCRFSERGFYWLV